MDNNKRLALKDLEEICDTGKFNILAERKRVLQYANQNGMFNLITYVENDSDKYLELIMSLK